MAEDQESRDWMLTIRAEGHTSDDVKDLFEQIGSGAVFQKERGGKTDYEHYQCFLQMETPMRWSTLKNHLSKAGFNDAHIETRKGTVSDCLKYCTKDESRISDPVYVGKIKLKGQKGARNDLAELREKILGGASVADVLLDDEESKAARYTKWLGELAAARDQREYGQKMRDIEVHYLYGRPGVGKTRYVYDRYPVRDIYRVTDYRHPFDEYDRQPVLVLDEYDSQFDWEKLLCYLDRYPLMLPARYHNHQACYTVVWILSNRPLADQYPFVQGDRRNALMRRIVEILRMDESGKLIYEKGHENDEQDT